MAYIYPKYTTDQWMTVTATLKRQILSIRAITQQIRRLEQLADAGDPSIPAFPLLWDELDAIHRDTVYNYSNFVVDALPASLNESRYKYIIKPGRPTAFTKVSVIDSGGVSHIVANAGQPFFAVTPGANGDHVKLRWLNGLNLIRTITGLRAAVLSGGNNVIELPAYINPDCVTNGNFAVAAEPNDWDEGAVWVIAAGVATAGAATMVELKQLAADFASAVEPGRVYQLAWQCNLTAGSLTSFIGDVEGSTQSTIGLALNIDTIMIPADADPIASFGFRPDATTGFEGTIDAVVLREVVPTDDASVEVELEAFWA